MTRRAVAGGVATVLLAAGLTAAGIAQPAMACACGAPAPPPGVSVSVGEEQAIVTFDGVTERIDLALDMLADGADTGLVLPTPTPATVSLGDRGVFEAIALQTRPEVVVEQDWWSMPSDSGVAGAPPEVLSEVDLGPVHAVTLAASDTAGLRRWLHENGYVIAPEVQALLGDYVDRGWSFAALKLTGEVPLDGALDPVRVEFSTAEAVYPLLLSQAASVPQTVRLFLFGTDRMEVAFADGGAYPGQVTWAGPVDRSALIPLGAYLTVVEAYFADPGSQITADLDIRSTGTREDYTPQEVRTEIVQLGGIPLGMLLLGAGTVFALLLVLMFASTARRRRR